MNEIVIVKVGKCEQFPEGAILKISSCRVRMNNTIYFKRSEVVPSLDGDTVVPGDTLIVLGDRVETDPFVNVALRVVTSTWSLQHGIHRGTMMSRDSKRTDGFESLEAVKNWYGFVKQAIEDEGYSVWFASAIPPKGNTLDSIQIDKGTPYIG